MFKHEKLFVGTDVVDRETLCKRLTENGATIVGTVGEQDSIHVFNSFEGGAFEDCAKKGYRVIGLPCLQETLRSGKALPRAPHPVYSRVMEGIVVSGDTVEEKAKLKNYVNRMNGTWSDELSGNTQYFITTEPGSIHYMWALALGSNIVQPSWITESWENSSLSDPKFHLLPPLTGCVISVTGLSTATRSTVQHLVTHYGGKYTQQLSRKVTHLLCDKPQGRKYMTALAWGMHIVTTNWLFDSINVKGTVDVSRYELSSMPPELDGGGDALYIRSPYSRSGPYNPMGSGARRLNNYTTPILVRRHRTSMGPPVFSLPQNHPQHMSSNSHQPVFAQTTQIQSGPSSHSSSASLSHPATSALRAPLLQQKYANTSRYRDKDGRSNMDRYRDMFEQLTGLLRMCDDLIEKSAHGTPTNNINNLSNSILNNNTLHNLSNTLSNTLNNLNNNTINNLSNNLNANNLNNNVNNNNINNNNINNNNINNNNINNNNNTNTKNTNNNIRNTNTSSNNNSNTESNVISISNNNKTNRTDVANNINTANSNSHNTNNATNTTNTNNNSQPTTETTTTTTTASVPSTTPTASVTTEDGTDIEMESDDEVTTTSTTSSEQEK